MAVVRATAWLPEELWRAARVWASHEGDTIAVLIRALEEFLTRRHEDHVERHPGKYATLVTSLSTPGGGPPHLGPGRRVLRTLQIRYVYQPVEKMPQDLRRQPNFGAKLLREIEDKLATLSLALGTTPDSTSYAAAVTAALVAGLRAAKTPGPASVN